MVFGSTAPPTRLRPTLAPVGQTAPNHRVLALLGAIDTRIMLITARMVIRESVWGAILDVVPFSGMPSQIPAVCMGARQLGHIDIERQATRGRARTYTCLPAGGAYLRRLLEHRCEVTERHLPFGNQLLDSVRVAFVRVLRYILHQQHSSITCINSSFIRASPSPGMPSRRSARANGRGTALECTSEHGTAKPAHTSEEREPFPSICISRSRANSRAYCRRSSRLAGALTEKVIVQQFGALVSRTMEAD